MLCTTAFFATIFLVGTNKNVLFIFHNCLIGKLSNNIKVGRQENSSYLPFQRPTFSNGMTYLLATEGALMRVI